MSTFLSVLILIVLGIFACNGIVALAAWIEYRRGANTEPWLGQSQTLEGDPSKPAIVLLHGFGGSPLELRSLAHRLNLTGHRVVAPLLPNQSRRDPPWSRVHGTTDEVLSVVRVLVAREEAATKQLPICIGFSMGGTIAALLAIEGRCQRLVLIAPFFGNAVLDRLAGVFRWVLLLVPKLRSGQINDPVGRAAYRPGTWFLSPSAYLSLSETARLAAAKASDIRVPTLAILSLHDAVAKAGEALPALNRIPKIRLLEAERANHVLPFDFGWEDLEAEIERFVHLPE